MALIIKLVCTVAVVAVTVAENSSHAGIIDFSAIIPSTTMTPNPSFPIDEISDGVSSDAVPGFNGFVSPDTSGVVQLDFASPYDLESFILYNDINVLSEGVRDFRLDFYDSGMSPIAVPFSAAFTGPLGQTAGEEYTFPSVVPNVARVDLVILNVFVGVATQTEIREVQFAFVPEPSTAMLVIALAGLVLIRSQRHSCF